MAEDGCGRRRLFPGSGGTANGKGDRSLDRAKREGRIWNPKRGIGGRLAGCFGQYQQAARVFSQERRANRNTVRATAGVIGIGLFTCSGKRAGPALALRSDDAGAAGTVCIYESDRVFIFRRGQQAAFCLNGESDRVFHRLAETAGGGNQPLSGKERQPSIQSRICRTRFCRGYGRRDSRDLMKKWCVGLAAIVLLGGCK